MHPQQAAVGQSKKKSQQIVVVGGGQMIMQMLHQVCSLDEFQEMFYR